MAESMGVDSSGPDRDYINRGMPLGLEGTLTPDA